MTVVRIDLAPWCQKQSTSEMPLYNDALCFNLLDRRRNLRASARNHHKLLTQDEAHYTPGTLCSHTCQATSCDGRCYAPTTYCGQSRVYDTSTKPTATVNYTPANVELKAPACQYHSSTSRSANSKRTMTPLLSKVPNDVADYNDMTSSLLQPQALEHEPKATTTTFSTFKPPESDTEAEEGHDANTRQPNGILKNAHCTGNLQCACVKCLRFQLTYERPISARQQETTAAEQPDVIQTNRQNEMTQIAYTNTARLLNMTSPRHNRKLPHSYSHSSA